MSRDTLRLPSLDEVFSLKTIAIVGVSGSGKLGYAEMLLMAHLEMGTPGLSPVNPAYQEVLGNPCYPSITDIPGPVDHVIVSVPAMR